MGPADIDKILEAADIVECCMDHYDIELDFQQIESAINYIVRNNLTKEG